MHQGFDKFFTVLYHASPIKIEQQFSDDDACLLFLRVNASRIYCLLATFAPGGAANTKSTVLFVILSDITTILLQKIITMAGILFILIIQWSA